MEFNLPKSWNDITLYQYLELQEIKKITFNNSVDETLELFSILLNTTPDDPIFDEIEIEEVWTELDKRIWLKDNIQSAPSKIINEFTLKSFNNILLGEFIDLEHHIDSGDLYKIIPILYKKTKVDDWDNIIEEPYIYSFEERWEIFLDVPIPKIVGVINNYLDWRKTFLASYDNLFLKEDDLSIDEENETELTGRAKIDAEIETLNNTKKSKWSWESILLGMSNNDVTKFEKLFGTSLILVFNTLSAKHVLEI
jgi:hypothetical protein